MFFDGCGWKPNEVPEEERGREEIGDEEKRQKKEEIIS